MAEPEPKSPRILLAGATGYIGRAVAAELRTRGYDVIAIVRKHPPAERPDAAVTEEVLQGVDQEAVELTDPTETVQRLGSLSFDAVVSCIASRSGVGSDAWAVDYRANLNLLAAARRRGVSHFVLLSAICVQRPKLEFQKAKLAFEKELMASGIRYSIVRPTAFFKSLAGQVRRVQQGKPFLLFGDGSGTACKPISERDLARYLVDCLEHPSLHNRILPIGGPGEAITPRRQGELLFELAGLEPRFRSVPVALFDIALALLSPLALVSSRLEAKAELARIGRYYATESMLLWDEGRRVYDAEATPAYGEDSLRQFYSRVLREGLAGQSLGDHGVFK